MSFQLKCRNCGAWLGESREPMAFRGCFETPRDREMIQGPRDAWRCKGCAFVNLFRPFTEREAERAVIEVKRSVA